MNKINIIQQIKDADLTYSQFWLNQLAKLSKDSIRYNKLIEIINKVFADAAVRQELIRTTKINYPPELPVSREVDSIKKLVLENQVIIICGETGSGKTTQLPKVLLELGYANRGLIGHTQPRRIAAKSLANRIGSELGFNSNTERNLVGYKMRFHDRTSNTTAIKLMTDGILLQEIQNDKLLLQYSALIIDEVHERSLNIDFILGYLQQLIKRRPDLKIIITSATLENEKLAKFFNTTAILNVTGKTYPVDIIYQPYNEDADDEMTLNQSIYQAIVAAMEVERGNGLVFLPGEREIKHCLQFLRKTTLKCYEILQLYAKQNNEEQSLIFNNDGMIKIILATNIAETSLTIPGIKFVIDTGLARVKRYSVRNRVEQLVVENISQASSKQRAGRAGRVSHGLCVRLFSEQEFNARKAYTEPELLRSNLANVILRLLSLNLGDPVVFPFLDVPENKAFNDGFRTLYQIGAIDEQNRITSHGRKLATIPIDVQLGRVLIAAGERFACLKEALIVISFLAVQDPREFPFEHQQLVKERHSIWKDKQSEFQQILNLWHWYHEELTHKKSNKKLLEVCHKHFLSVVRMREWHELHRQLKENLLSLQYRENTTPASYENLHRAILSGFVVNIGQKNLVENHYVSTNGRKFYLHPSLQVDSAKWMITTSLVETTRLYARHCAMVEPEWLNGVADHLYRYTYTNQHWDKKRGEVMANKTALLYGLAISNQKISYSKIDMVLARDIFIREALVATNINKTYPFMSHNANVVRAIEKLEEKLRTSLTMIEDELYEFYAQNLALDVVDITTFEQFLQINSEHLQINQDEFIAKLVSSNQHQELYPDYLMNNGKKIRLQYIFDHDSNEDGVVASIDISALTVINAEVFAWLVPGVIRDKINYLIKALPKSIRVQFNPVPESVSAFLAMANVDVNLLQQFVDFAKQYKNIELEYVHLLEIKFPVQYRCHFRILENKKIVASGDDLVLLRQELATKLDKIVVKHTSSLQINNVTDYISEMVNLLGESQVSAGHNKLIGFYSLIIEKDDSVTFGVVADLSKAQLSTRRGLLQLVKLHLKDQQKYLMTKKIANFANISMALIDVYNKDNLILACSNYILNQSIIEQIGNKMAFSSIEFKQLIDNSRSRVSTMTTEFNSTMTAIANLYKQVKLKIINHPLEEVILLQLDDLIYSEFLNYTRREYLIQYPRYLQGILTRLDKYSKSPNKDAIYEDDVNKIYDKWYNYVEQLKQKNKVIMRELYDFNYKIEELRISLFAQEVRTLYPVSSKRLLTELDNIYLINLK